MFGCFASWNRAKTGVSFSAVALSYFQVFWLSPFITSIVIFAILGSCAGKHATAVVRCTGK